MPSQTKSQRVAENATLRARLAELEARLASRTPGKGKELPESDITERKRIEDALKASEVRYRRLFETAKDGLLIWMGTRDGSPTKLPSSRNCWVILTPSCSARRFGKSTRSGSSGGKP